MTAYDDLMILKGTIDERMTQFFDEFDGGKMESSYRLGKMMLKIRDFNSRGKRLRPAFIVKGYEAVGGKDFDAVLSASLCIELSQGFFLIHDDMMDQDELRRGHKTVYAQAKDVFDEEFGKGDRDHFGFSMGLLAGDINVVLAYYPLLNSKFPADVKLRALSKLNDILFNTCHGQLLDFTNGFKEKVSLEDSLRVDRLKTSYYTIAGPLQLGVILAGGSEKALKVMEEYAIPLGLAFQLQDDILGVFGDEKKLGKPVGSDVKEGKRTLLVLKALEFGSDEQKAVLNGLLGKQDLSLEELEQFRGIIKDTGSLDFVKKEAFAFVVKSKAALESSGFDPKAQEFLLDIADFMVKREN